MSLEFNNLTEQVFSQMDLSILGGSPSTPPQNKDAVQRNLGPWEVAKLLEQGKMDVFNGNYQAAAQKFTLCKERDATSSRWLRITAQFTADVMEAASYPGCPQSLAARAIDILSRSLRRERDKYSRLHPNIENESELRDGLTALKDAANFWVPILVQQRALQIWEPILGRHHPKMALIRDFLHGALVAEFDLDAAYESVDTLDIYGPPGLDPVKDLIHLGDAPAEWLLEQLQAIESSSVSDHPIKQEVALLRLGRSRALLGVYYSFIRRFDEAEEEFQISERHLERETCVEIRLHRTIWYAEHKTRVGDWDGVTGLLCRAHEVFMANDTPSEFVLRHFPEQFAALCSAVSEHLPIDNIVGQAPRLRLGDPEPASPGNSVTATFQPSPPAEDFVLSPSRLFPPTPRGVHSEIDIDAWRRFVHYHPPDQRETPGRVTCIE